MCVLKRERETKRKREPKIENEDDRGDSPGLEVAFL